MDQQLWTDLCDVRDSKLRELVKDLPKILAASREKSTIKNYSYSFHRFKVWAQQFLELSYLPASNKSVALYILSLLQSGKSYSVIRSTVAAIAWFHNMSGLSDCTKSDMVGIVLEGAKRLSSEPIQKKEPITSDILASFRNYSLRPDGSINLMDQRNISFCILAYAAFFRFSEVSRIKRNHIEFFDSYMSIMIPKAKTDVYHQGKMVIVAKTGTELCPFANLS